jgi:hypothetical protein
MTTNPISHVSVGTAISQAEFEQASGHDLDGNFNLGANLLVGNGGSTGLAISANGEITMAAQPCVLAHNSATDTNVTGNGATATVDFDTEIFDQNADFAADTFTAPVTGRYLVCVTYSIFGGTTSCSQVSQNIVASNRDIRCVWKPTDGANAGQSLTAIIDMDAADTFTITLTGSGESSNVQDIDGGGSPHTTHISVLLVA